MELLYVPFLVRMKPKPLNYQKEQRLGRIFFHHLFHAAATTGVGGPRSCIIFGLDRTGV